MVELDACNESKDEETQDRPIEEVVREVMTTTRKKPQKSKVENLNIQIINDDNFVHLNKYYILHTNKDKLQLENVLVGNIILNNKIFQDTQRKILGDLYNRQVNRRKRVFNRDKSIKENMIKKFCEVKSDEDMDDIMKAIKPLLRHKRKSYYFDQR